MTDYTPTTEEIADWWAHKGGSAASPYYASKLTKRAKEFDRWLAAERAKAWEEGAESAFYNPEIRGLVDYPDNNPYREGRRQ